MTDDKELTRLLREALAARADRAPDGAGLAERILHEAALRPAEVESRHRWRGWTLPLVAAGAVAAVVLAMVVVGHLRATTVHATPAASGPAPRASVHTQPVASASADASGTVGPQSNPNLDHFSAVATTFVGPDAGWILGSADCLRGSGRCTAMVRSTYGSLWTQVLNPPVNVSGVQSCASYCATGLRFADSSVGYAFGPDTLAMTTDGGATWARQPGGAYALETLDNNVIRIVADHSGCPGPCNVRVQYAALGSSHWTSVQLPGGPVDAGTVALSRTGSAAYLATFPGTAGAPLPAQLYVSTDDGHTWTQHADPCRALGAWVGQELTTAEDGSASVLCASQDRQAIMTSTDGGGHFTAGPAFQLDGGQAGSLAAASATTFVVSAGRGIYRTVDAGAHWALVQPDRSSGGPALCGFQSALDVHCTSNDGRTLYASHDAGAHWSRVPLS